MSGRVLLVTALLLCTGAALSSRSRDERVPPRETFGSFPFQVDEWRGETAPRIDQRTLALLGVDDYVNRTYTRRPDVPVGLYVGYYASQKQGDTIHSPMNCLPGAGWQPIEVGRTRIDVPGHGTIEINRVLIEKGEQRQVVLYWYQSRGRVIAGEVLSKAFMVFDSVTRSRTDGALVRVVVPVQRSEAALREADDNATEFTRAIFPQLLRFLPV